MSEAFTLDPRLERDTVAVAIWPLSLVRLMNDRRFPWLVLVPRRAGLREPTDLPMAGQETLWQEILRASRALKSVTMAEKMNIGLLGNVVPQLHAHVIARFAGDAAWPGPVWGAGVREPYAEDALSEVVARVQAAL